MLLDATTRKIQVILGEAKTTNDCPIVAAYFDSATVPTGGTQVSNSNGTSAVDVVAAPGAATIRQVNELTFFNADTVTHNVTVRYNDNGTTYTIRKFTLLTGEMFCYSKSGGWYCLDASGNVKNSFNSPGIQAWTPSITIGGGTTGITYTAQEGWYQVVGNRVFIDAIIVLSSKGALTGNVGLNLPVTVVNVGTIIRYNGLVALQNLNASTAFLQAFPAPGPGTNTTLIFYTAVGGASISNLVNTDLTNTSVFRLSMNVPLA